MKVLILHQHFKTPASGGAIRSYYLARALVERNIEVTVITGWNEKEYRKVVVEGIEVHYLPIAYDNRFGFAARGFSFIRYVSQSVLLAGKLKGITMCYAISTPLTVGIAAMRIKARFQVPYIFEVGDLWPEAPVQLGFIKNPLFREFLFWMEKRIYERAESIVGLSSSIQKVVKTKAPDKQVHLIPNMADCEYYKPEKKDAALETAFGVSGKFVVSYTGALGIANGLDYFLECANASRKAKPEIHFLVCGDGAVSDRLQSGAKRLGLENISFLGFQNREMVRSVLNVTDAIFVCYKNVPVLETGSPNKYFDGLAAGKLVIVNFSGWIKEECERGRCGIWVDPQNPSDFIQKISPFLSDEKLLRDYQTSARKLGEEKYDRKKLSEEFVNLFPKGKIS
jgi:glycosyltransferase involved in cell wall biosynthesis